MCGVVRQDQAECPAAFATLRLARTALTIHSEPLFVFQCTKVPLWKWFLTVAFLVNSWESVFSHHLARDLNLNQKMVW